MRKKSQNIISSREKKKNGFASRLLPFSAIAAVLVIWQTVSMTGLVPEFMLPSPVGVARAFIGDFPLLMSHLWTSLAEAFLGLGLGILVGFLAALLMDSFEGCYRAFYPVIVITQTIPTIAIAPLLVLWMGYDIAPKVTLIVIVTFFPIAVGLLEGFRSADEDALRLLKAMGAGRWQIFRYVKFPQALNSFFGSLRISVSYSVVGAVIAEWLGGYKGLGVYMTRVRSAYAFDKMFAVIFLISAISLLLMGCVTLLRKKCMPWEKK